MVGGVRNPHMYMHAYISVIGLYQKRNSTQVEHGVCMQMGVAGLARRFRTRLPIRFVRNSCVIICPRVRCAAVREDNFGVFKAAATQLLRSFEGGPSVP